MVYFKVTDGRTTRKFQMKPGEHSYTQLKEKLAVLFPEAMKMADDPFHLHYTDSEGDMITISADDEFQEVLTQLPADATWKLHIQPQRKQQTTAARNRSSPLYGSSFLPLSQRPRTSRYHTWLPLSSPFPYTHSSFWDHVLDTGFEEALQRHAQLYEALSKEAMEGQDQKQESSENASGENQERKEDKEESKVSRKTESSVPGLRIKNFGSWEPREFDGPFGQGTVIGPVGYYLSWSSEGNKKQESTPEASQGSNSEKEKATAEDKS